MKTTTELKGTLEIDHARGVIYFHLSDPADLEKFGTQTPLRICQLPQIPVYTPLDITYGVGVSWSGSAADN